MTKRLFDLDSHMRQAESLVISCAPAGDGFNVVLDQTVFFPESGGQPSDTGSLGEAVVSHVREEGSIIVHRLDRAISPGARVTGRIDWARRFDLMQQHTGEHLLSFSFYELFGASNIGFHLALDHATIDFDQPLSRGQIAEAELLANRFVWKKPARANDVLRNRGGGQPPSAEKARLRADTADPHRLCGRRGHVHLLRAALPNDRRNRIDLHRGRNQLQGRNAHHLLLRRTRAGVAPRAARRAGRNCAALFHLARQRP